MKFKDILRITLAVIMTAIIVIVLMYRWHTSVTKEFMLKQRSDDQVIRSRDVIIRDLEKQIARYKDAISGKNENLPPDLLVVYTYDCNINRGFVQFGLIAPDNYTLLQKLNFIADVLMKYKFKKGLIKIKSIEDRGGKKIAIVDLLETKVWPSAWKGYAFQGSCGGSATTFILTNTFLQRTYGGAWVDGVEFYYEGKPISDEWDHIRLHGTFYRNLDIKR